MVKMKSALNGLRVSDLMLTEFRCLEATDTLDQARSHFLAGWQRQFPVIDEGGLTGVLTGSGLVQGLEKHGPTGLVGEAMERAFAEASPEEPAETALSRLESSSLPIMPVTISGQLVGIVTVEKVRDFLMVRSAQGVPAQAAVPPLIATAKERPAV